MRLIAFIFMLFTFSLSKAQEIKVSETELKERAESEIDEFYQKFYDADSTKLRQKAYESYSALVKNFPESRKLSFYLFEKASLTHDKEEAKSSLKKVIEINDWKYYIRQSYLKLSWYAVDEKDFKTASEYLNKIEKMEKPGFTCGNEMESYYAQLKSLRKRCETGLKK